MVQNQVTILGWNGPNGAFRQVRPLAEGQKSADVKHDFHNTTPLRQPRQLAERVEFPEKNAGSHVFAPSFGGGGPPAEVPPDLMAILNHADFATLPHARK